MDTGGSPDWVQNDLALRYERYIAPLEQLGSELIDKGTIAVSDEEDQEAAVERLGEIYRKIHALRGRFQDEVRTGLSPEGLEFSKSQREGHKDDWAILMEAVTKNFTSGDGNLDRALTVQDRIFLYQYLIHGATRTRPELRKPAFEAYMRKKKTAKL